MKDSAEPDAVRVSLRWLRHRYSGRSPSANTTELKLIVSDTGMRQQPTPRWTMSTCQMR